MKAICVLILDVLVEMTMYVFKLQNFQFGLKTGDYAKRRRKGIQTYNQTQIIQQWNHLWNYLFLEEYQCLFIYSF